jgi:D-serine deaminase-like pyridoxal phosphate-dependent protein
MTDTPASIGDTIDRIDTPALIVDLDAFESNLGALAAFARDSGVRLRPHAKTHKCALIAMKQIAAGAVGQCCQKVGEAEALVAGGVRDVLVTNEIVDRRKLERLAARGGRDQVCASIISDAAWRRGGEAGVAELGVGRDRHRLRRAAGALAAALARRIADARAALWLARTRAPRSLHTRRARACHRDADAVRATLAALEQDRLRAIDRPGAAGTGRGRQGLWNELQAGSYLFMDTEYASIDGNARPGARYDEFAHSLFVLSSVMSLPARDRAIVDAGLKSFSAEKGLPWVHGRAGIEVTSVSDEHARLELGANAKPLALGEKVMLIPGHCDPTINLHDTYVAVRAGRVEALWPISARGASR